MGKRANAGGKGAVAFLELGISDLSRQITESGSRAADLIDFFCQNSPAQWFIFASLMFAGFLLGRLTSAVLAFMGRKLAARGWTARAHLPADLAAPAWLAVFTLGLNARLVAMTLNPTTEAFARGLLKLLYSLSAFWYAYNLVGIIEASLHRFRNSNKMQVDRQLIVPLRKTLRTLIAVIAALFIFSVVFGWDVRAWLAGLGIAGLAVSLAAQDTIKSLFGAFAIIIDRPFRIGERIIYAGYDGVIEEIGIRSTKLRTLDGHLVTIPNSSIVSSSVENPARRPYIKRTINVTVTYDTPKAKIEEALAIIKNILEEDGIREPIHRRDDNPPRVFFNDLNADSLNILVVYWHVPPDYWQYMAHAQRLNLRLIEEFERAGIEFAFPTQTLYLAGDEKRRLAVEMLRPNLP